MAPVLRGGDERAGRPRANGIFSARGPRGCRTARGVHGRPPVLPKTTGFHCAPLTHGDPQGIGGNVLGIVVTRRARRAVRLAFEKACPGNNVTQLPCVCVTRVYHHPLCHFSSTLIPLSLSCHLNSLSSPASVCACGN
ncbi:hypothetical protein AAFF_G00289110 [Aldrovandia affinis]|uniref:Uncharacterized protein n=1 Tax=Aldrovandia affinis TaxID=143900 RepID=A0AAD7W105_9TELE|nr:hypothetical protein AAFF_G00289110 [Aldrovandia affinis]